VPNNRKFPPIALSFNGQRCTSLKLFFIPKGHGAEFSKLMADRIDSMHVGLPWQTWGHEDGQNDSKPTFSHFTPLPNKNRTDLMRRLIDDAVSKGAQIVNKKGGEIIGGIESTLMVPAVLYPVTPDMDIYYEEQFGPIVPITEYENLDTVLTYGQKGQYGQQVSIFVSEEETKNAAKLLDRFSTVFGKININSQCARSPDTLPFSGRRSSAMGVMSVRDALREFSIPTVVAYKDSNINTRIMQEIESASTFLQPF
jgi:glyceraldehyde-3-phosphate dehydrogenase (NADP+)